MSQRSAGVTAAAMRRQLRAHANPASVAILHGFFKTAPGEYGEGDRFIGVKFPALRTICRACRGAQLDEVVKVLQSP